MIKTRLIYLFIVVLISSSAMALEPEEILIIANAKNPDSLRLAHYYSKKRNVPVQNIFTLNLEKPLASKISRQSYERFVTGPIKAKLKSPQFDGKIKCLLTTYGIPYMVKGRGLPSGSQNELTMLKNLTKDKTKLLLDLRDRLYQLGQEDSPSKNNTPPRLSLDKLLKNIDSDLEKARQEIQKTSNTIKRQKLLSKWLEIYARIRGKTKGWENAQQKADIISFPDPEEQKQIKDAIRIIYQAGGQRWSVKQKLERRFYSSVEKAAGLYGLLRYFTNDIDTLKGRETSAALDSELSMVLFDNYELNRWQPNELKTAFSTLETKTIMVARLDGPSPEIPFALIDKAIKAEQNGLRGTACFDLSLRSDPVSKKYDESLTAAAALFNRQPSFKVRREKTSKLFAPGTCPQTAIYCGWYSLKKYIDAFDFVDGAVGYHIASFEAADLRNPNSAQWCSAMLKDGITATLGPVAEPYLGAFPKPDAFFNQLLNGQQLVHAFYKTKPYNSWQLLLIGDPLYAPFKKNSK